MAKKQKLINARIYISYPGMETHSIALEVHPDHREKMFEALQTFIDSLKSVPLDSEEE